MRHPERMEAPEAFVMRVQSHGIDPCVPGRARQSANKLCLLVLAVGILGLLVMDLAVVNNDGDHIHFQPDVVG